VIGKDDVIIVKKRKKHPHKGHGGAWKVAYADFVTAMMAFFLVMWIVGQSRSVRAAVAGYFREPGIFDQQKSNGPLPGGEMRLGPNQANEDPSSKEVLKEAQQALEKAASRIKSLLAETPELKRLEKQIEITVTRDGLRIELLEGAEPTFFASGSAALAPGTESVLELISQELGKLKNEIALEGHTDSQPYSKSGSYTNWELSADRANAARRIMERSGLRGGQITEIRGYADTSLRVKSKPLDPRNRRVSVIVQHAWKESDLPEKLRAGGAASAPPPAGADGKAGPISGGEGKAVSDRKPAATPPAGH
jgi:chemotaxis protein MotB